MRFRKGELIILHPAYQDDWEENGTNPDSRFQVTEMYENDTMVSLKNITIGGHLSAPSHCFVLAPESVESSRRELLNIKEELGV